MKKIFALVLIFMIAITGCYCQLNVTLGAIKTDLKNNAIDVGITYLRSLDSIWKNREHAFVGHNAVVSFNPEIAIQTGSQDAFSFITAKVTALYIKFKDTTVHGLKTPNSARGFQTFPASIGVETNNLFNTANGIIEIGWVPWYQTSKKLSKSFIRRTKFGLFLQGGYKFLLDSTGKKAVGGQVDQSGELPNSAVFRAKGSFGIDTKKLISAGGINLGLVGDANGWYDFMHTKTYYTIEGKARIYISDSKYFDAVIKKGAGPPTFNRGTQYGMNLTIVF